MRARREICGIVRHRCEPARLPYARPSPRHCCLDVADAPTTKNIRRAGDNPPTSARRRLSLRSGVLPGTVRPIRTAANERFACLARWGAVDTATLGLGGRGALVSATLRPARRPALVSATLGPARQPVVGVAALGAATLGPARQPAIGVAAVGFARPVGAATGRAALATATCRAARAYGSPGRDSPSRRACVRLIMGRAIVGRDIIARASVSRAARTRASASRPGLSVRVGRERWPRPRRSGLLRHGPGLARIRRRTGRAAARRAAAPAPLCGASRGAAPGGTVAAMVVIAGRHVVDGLHRHDHAAPVTALARNGEGL